MKRRTAIRSSSVVGDSTARFYETHAREYFDRTVSADLSALYDDVLKHVRPGGRVLDAGCGSGRDLKIFRARGFDVTGIDASNALVKLARGFSGADCTVMRLEDVNFSGFDAVWACASLLHLPKRSVVSILRRLRLSLAEGGILFASVQLGQGEVLKPDGRFFAYYAPDEFARRIEKAGFVVDRAWVSEDSLPGRSAIRWINVVAHRESDDRQIEAHNSSVTVRASKINKVHFLQSTP